MKSSGFVSLLICVLAAISLSQEVSTAVLVDEFYDINCEAQRGNLDRLLGELRDSPELHGVIVLHGEPRDSVLPYQQKNTIFNHLKFRGFDPARVHFRLGKNEPKFRTELWKSPPQEVKRFDGGTWDYKLIRLDRPLLVHAESWIDAIGCGWFAPDLEFYSKFLRANAGLTGRVIIRDKSLRRFNRARATITGELKSKYKVDTSRLEFAYLPSDRSDVEYWYVPSYLFNAAETVGTNAMK